MLDVAEQTLVGSMKYVLMEIQEKFNINFFKRKYNKRGLSLESLVNMNPKERNCL